MIKYKSNAILREFIFYLIFFFIVLVKLINLILKLVFNDSYDSLTLIFGLFIFIMILGFFLILNIFFRFNEIYVDDDDIVFVNIFRIKKNRKIINLLRVYETQRWGIITFEFYLENDINFCIPIITRTNDFKETIKNIANLKRSKLNKWEDKIKFKLSNENEIIL